MRHKAAALLLFLLAALLPLGTTASANSAQTSWSGVDASGAIVTGGDCPIVVEKELLTFRLEEFPQSHYEDEESFLDYSGMVTARYTFYNPSNQTVTARLAFPFGAYPDYGYVHYDEALEAHVNADDTTKFRITANDEPVEVTLRHTLFDPYDQFELEEDLALLQDGFVSDGFFSPDLPVTRYDYVISGVDEEAYPAANAALEVGEFDGKRKLLLVQQSGGHTQEDGSVRISLWAENGMEVTLYCIGEPLEQLPSWTFYADGGVEDGEEIPGAMALTGTGELTFRELALTARDPGSGVSESDWYSALVADWNRTGWMDAGFIYAGERYGFDLSGALMRWYTYELTLEPGERLVNTVEAPMYPAIDSDYEPPIYPYTYLLSPASTWEEFGRLDIVIDTPYHLTESSLEGFEQTEEGYALSLESLPDGELTFTLSTGEHPQPPRAAAGNRLLPAAIITAAVVILLAIGVALRRRKRAK